MPDTIHHLTKEYKVCRDSEFRKYLKEIEKLFCEEFVFRNYTEADIM